MSFDTSLSRRQFVNRSAAAALLTALPGRRLWTWPHHLPPASLLSAQAQLADPATMRALALRAVDAARAAGAIYADVRITRIVKHSMGFNGASGNLGDLEGRAVGVRALVNGAWGFAASPYWEADEMNILATEAVAQAKVNATASPRHIELGTIPAATGSWVTPGIDPFSVTIEEKIDFINSYRQAVLDAMQHGLRVTPDSQMGITYSREEQFLASTEGTACLQTLFSVGGSFPVDVAKNQWKVVNNAVQAGADGWDTQRRGWDALLAAKIRDQIPALVEQGVEQLALRSRPVQIGRYTMVFDAATTASLLHKTLGVATQLDRSLGLEANSVGTSYLGPDPMAHLGTPVGSPLLTVTANRTMPGGNATVKWDDEGVVPSDFTLVKNGTLVDYQTTREQSAWLASWYQKQGVPVQSHGCAAAPSAMYVTRQHIPNLVLAPGAGDATFESMVAAVPKGIAIQQGGVRTDFQAKTGMGSGLVREITNGKLGPVVSGAGFLFEATEMWKNLAVLGGAGSVEHVTAGNVKGQPQQGMSYTLAAVPATFTNVGMIDINRRA